MVGMYRPRILFVAVNLLSTDSSSTGELALEQEFAAIQRELLLTRYRDFELIHARAVTVDDIMRHLTEQEPLILHFAGHGAAAPRHSEHSTVTSRDISAAAADSEFGIYLRDERDRPQLVTIRALKTMIASAAPSVRVVVLNACYSDAQAETLCEVVDCVISMAGAVEDSAARSFSAALYRALGNGRSVGNAFAQAVATLDGKQFPDKVLPKCRTRNRLDARQMFLTRAPARDPGQRPQPVVAGRLHHAPPRRRKAAVMAATIALTLVALAAGIESLVSLIGGMKDARGQPAPSPPEPQLLPSPASIPDKPPSKKGSGTVRPAHNTSGEATRTEPKPGKQPSTPVSAQTRKPLPPSSTRPVAAVSSLGDLDKETVQLYLSRHHQRIKHCYEQRLLVKPALAGTVTARFVVAPDGTVASSTASGLDDAVSSCIAGVIRDISFPRSGSSLKVTTPFQLVPSDG